MRPPRSLSLAGAAGSLRGRALVLPTAFYAGREPRRRGWLRCV